MSKHQQVLTLFGFRVIRNSAAWKWILKNKARLLGWTKKKPPAPPPPPKPVSLLMYDDTKISLLPPQLEAVAGYVDGRYANILQVLAKYPTAKHLSIAVFAIDNADCLDVETGDATPEQAPAWVKHQIANWHKSKHDVAKPVVYTQVSKGNLLNDVLRGAGLVLHRDYFWWSAHYDPRFGKHICGPKTCGYVGLRYNADATQFTDRANNVSLDESWCSPGFFA